jgi:hypothetical protein
VRLWGVGTELVDQVMDGPAGTVGKWSHIVGVFNSSTDRKLYVDGVLINTDTDAMTLGTPTALYVFRGSTAPMMAADDVRVYNRALSGEEVLQLYNMGNANKIKTSTTSVGSGLAGYWTFDGADTYWSSATAGTVTDKSGNGRAGTMTNMSRSISPSIGKIGQALNFDGADDYVEAISSAVSFPVTLVAWFRPQTINSNVILSHNSSLNNGYRIGISSSDKPTFTLGSVADYPCSTFSSLTSGKWYFLAVTVTGNGGTRTCYFAPAGEKIQIDPATAIGTMSGTPNRITIGRRGDSNGYFNGKIDDVRLYDRVLSQSEIEKIYSAGR